MKDRQACEDERDIKERFQANRHQGSDTMPVSRHVHMQLCCKVIATPHTDETRARSFCAHVFEALIQTVTSVMIVCHMLLRIHIPIQRAMAVQRYVRWINALVIRSSINRPLSLEPCVSSKDVTILPCVLF